MNIHEIIAANPLIVLSFEEKKASIEEAVQKINSGEILSVSSSSRSMVGLCIGDFREVGWSERCSDRRGLWYDWNGPVAIKVDGQLVEPGKSTEYWEMDWS